MLPTFVVAGYNGSYEFHQGGGGGGERGGG